MHVEQGPQFGVGGLLDRPDMGAARIVDEYVDPAVPGHDIGHHRVDHGGIGDVQFDGVHLVGIRGDEIVQCRGASGGSDDDVTCGDRRLGDRRAETAVRTCDQPYLAHVPTVAGNPVLVQDPV